MSKITVIGVGFVGSTIAYTLTVKGLASEVCLIDVNETKAFGEALDIKQGTPFSNPCSVYSGTYADAVNSDIVIVTSGLARKPGQSRLDLAQANVDITMQIMKQITKYAPNAIYILVSNPVDILTYTFIKYSGLPEKQIMGSGTMLDTSRLRSVISETCAINQHNVHAYVFGEHGDSSFVPWSLVNISGIPVDVYRESLLDKGINCKTVDHDWTVNYIHTSGATVINSKGATYFAISASVCNIVKNILAGVDCTMTVSTMLHGEYGIDDVCVSILNVVGREGVKSKIVLPLTKSEQKDLQASADRLKEVIKGLTFKN